MIPIDQRLRALTPAQRSRLEALVAVRRDVTRLTPGRVPVDRPLPLTAGQERLWTVQQQFPGKPIDVVSQTVHLPDTEPLEALKRLEDFCTRHEAFRLRFERTPQGVRQVVNGQPRVALSVGEPVSSEAEAASAVIVLAAATTDLDDGPLLRAQVSPGPDGSSWCLVAVHNIVFDAWSFQLLREALDGQNTPESATFPDFADWQRAWIDHENGTHAAERWREIVQSPPMPLPCDAGRSQEATRDGARLVVDIPQVTTDCMTSLAQRASCSVFSVWATAVHAVAARYGGTDDVLIGIFTSNREQPASQGTVGYLLNVVPLRLQLGGTVRERVQGAWAAIRSAQRFGAYPGEIVAERWTRGIAHAHPLFDWVLVHEEMAAATSAGWSHQVVADIPRATARYDLTITVDSGPNGAQLWLEYDTSRYHAETIADLGGRLAAECERLGASSADGTVQSARHTAGTGS
ncbi:condensation domain-containing protein [Rhodococcus tibetensis]|uniref:Condensation domain-containing protein n=1 Tax=Rhodococcus tibetensis TaxID=2965064 RepID=A0ABT1QL27_9NOCA|nr:condensation domain-containing protein [Rhodococcus sp. FXJ9.536]MCQ4122368.1 condensation domain-containing protein [Rhodococcus sp. FXJ9.536]